MLNDCCHFSDYSEPKKSEEKNWPAKNWVRCVWNTFSISDSVQHSHKSALLCIRLFNRIFLKALKCEFPQKCWHHLCRPC